MEHKQQVVKKTRATLNKYNKMLDEESLDLYRNFNSIFRQFAQDTNLYDYVRDKVELSDVELSDVGLSEVKLGKVEDGIFNRFVEDSDSSDSSDNDTNRNDEMNRIDIPEYKLEKVIEKNNKSVKKIRRRRVIVWNAWVVDTSSESDSDSD
jgi:hypothetical protein